VVASPGKVLRKLIGVTKGSGVIMRIRLKHWASQQIFAVVVLKFSCISEHGVVAHKTRADRDVTAYLHSFLTYVHTQPGLACHGPSPDVFQSSLQITFLELPKVCFPTRTYHLHCTAMGIFVLRLVSRPCFRR
jgi:hypothetical protein